MLSCYQPTDISLNSDLDTVVCYGFCAKVRFYLKSQRKFGSKQQRFIADVTYIAFLQKGHGNGTETFPIHSVKDGKQLHCKIFYDDNPSNSMDNHLPGNQ